MPAPKSNYYIDNQKFLQALIEFQKQYKNDPHTKINDYIGKCILLICERIATRGNFSGYCVDAKTEALTKRGWLRYDQINDNDIILSMDVVTRELKWSKIYEIYKSEYDGLMFYLKGSTLDALVTPHHKFVTENGLKEIDDISGYDHFITMGLPVNNVDEPIYSDALVELVGWFITEGSISKYYQKRKNKFSEYITIYQSNKVNEEKCKDIRKCLNEINPNGWKESFYKEGMSEFRLYKGIINEQLLTITKNKIPSLEFIFSLTQPQRLLLINTMLRGDGWHGKQYFQKNKEHIDIFLILCTLAGISAYTSYREWLTKFGWCKGYTVTLSSQKECKSSCVNFFGGKKTSGGNWNIKKNKPTIPYKGIIWCPRTEYGTFVCRRNNRIYVTGNTYIDSMIGDAIEDCIAGVRSFNPTIRGKDGNINPYGYFTKIVWWAFLQRIEIEKRHNYIKHKNFQQSHMQHEIEHILDEGGGGSFHSDLSDQVIRDFEIKRLTQQNKCDKVNKIAKKKKGK